MKEKNMIKIPLSIAKYIRSFWMAKTIITYLHIDKNANLVDWGGHPQHYGLSDLIKGKPAAVQVNFLEGMLDIPHSQILEFVRVGSGHSAHVHVVPIDDSTYVLMFDATAEHDQQQKIQQQANELSILTYRQTQLLQELETARQTLAEEKRQLEQTSNVKSSLIATLSDESRAQSMVGYNELLEEVKQADVNETEYLNTVKNNANQLLSLIDNVLDQAKLEAGQAESHITICDVKQLLADLKSLFFSNAIEKGLIFETKIEGTLSGEVMLDELHLRQVLINLITNALKFTKKGFVKVAVGWQNDRLKFSVAASRPGISLEAQNKIFTAFQGENLEKTLPTAGLGLAISHHFVKLMGGELTLESSLEQGTVFKGFVPASLAHYRNSLEEIFGEGATILVADDSAEIYHIIELYLEVGGYKVVNARNGSEAVESALLTLPDLVLMDLHMPVMNGYEAVQQLRSDGFTKPIIAMSSSSTNPDRDYALEVGCDHYLTKPVSPEDLLKTIEELLDHTQV